MKKVMFLRKKTDKDLDLITTHQENNKLARHRYKVPAIGNQIRIKKNSLE
jgi:hypothetical protein